MSNDYYKNLLIEKLKKDIISELSERCNNNQELVTIVNEYFDEIVLILSIIKVVKSTGIEKNINVEKINV